MRKIEAGRAAARRGRRGTARRPRATPGPPAPQAVARLRRLFPEVWAWYELLASARGIPLAPAEPPDRSAESG